MEFYGISFTHPYKQSVRWQDVLDKKKVCILLVLITQVYHNSRFKYRNVYVHIITWQITEYQYTQPCILHTLNIVLVVNKCISIFA